MLLGCIGPLKIVEECVTNYIEQTNLLIEKGGEEKGEEKNESTDIEENESSEQKDKGVDSETRVVDMAGGAGSALFPSVMVLTVCWLAPLHTAHLR